MSELNTVGHQDWPIQTRHDDALTVIMPSAASRVGLARRALRSLEAANVAWPIIIGDFSGPTERLALRALAKQFRSLDITLVEQLPHQHMLERIADCADQAQTPYALVHADDDFLVASAAERCVDVLLGNPGLAAVKGQISFCSINDKSALVANINEGHSCDAHKAYARVLRQVAAFSPTFHALHRTEVLADVSRKALAMGDNVVFWQYLASVWTVAAGAMVAIDDLFYIRDDNPSGTRAHLIDSKDLSHWPYLVVASDFSAQLAKFNGIVTDILSTAKVDPHEVELSVREVSMWLVRRGLGGPAPEPKSPAEQRLKQALAKPGSLEHRLFSFAGESIRAYRAAHPA